MTNMDSVLMGMMEYWNIGKMGLGVLKYWISSKFPLN